MRKKTEINLDAIWHDIQWQFSPSEVAHHLPADRRWLPHYVPRFSHLSQTHPSQGSHTGRSLFHLQEEDNHISEIIFHQHTPSSRLSGVEISLSGEVAENGVDFSIVCRYITGHEYFVYNVLQDNIVVCIFHIRHIPLYKHKVWEGQENWNCQRSSEMLETPQNISNYSVNTWLKGASTPTEGVKANIK